MHPRVVFLPGAAGDGRYWQPVADLLDPRLERVFVNWPGLGSIPRHPRALPDSMTWWRS